MGKKRFYGKSEIFPFTSVENPAIITERKTKCARSSMDRASDSGSECWGFESLRAYQKERHAEKRVFLFGFRRLKGGSTLRAQNAWVGKAAPAQFPAAGRDFTRHSARGPEGLLGSVSSNGLKDENIDFNGFFQLVASDMSLATSFFISLQNSSRAHSVAPRFQTGPAVAGLRFGDAAARRFFLIARKCKF